MNKSFSITGKRNKLRSFYVEILTCLTYVNFPVDLCKFILL